MKPFSVTILFYLYLPSFQSDIRTHSSDSQVGMLLSCRGHPPANSRNVGQSQALPIERKDPPHGHQSGQSAANAANAQLSTGPRSEAGKARSSANALKHGLTAKQVVVREDEIQKFNDLLDFMLTEINPQGALEVQTFNILIHASRNIDRFRTLEGNLMVNGLDPVFDDSASKVLDRIHRYHNQALRNYHKAMNELRTLQTSRALRKATLDEEEAKEMPALVSMSDLLKATQAEVRALATIATATAVHQAVKSRRQGTVGLALRHAKQ